VPSFSGLLLALGLGRAQALLPRPRGLLVGRPLGQSEAVFAMEPDGTFRLYNASVDILLCAKVLAMLECILNLVAGADPLQTLDNSQHFLVNTHNAVGPIINLYCFEVHHPCYRWFFSLLV
jgi:hypothetical protein